MPVLVITDDLIKKLPYHGPKEISTISTRSFDMVCREVQKLELKQEYRQPEKPYDKEVFSGRWNEALRHIPWIIENNKPMYESLSERSVDLTRCRCIKLPMSAYTKWEVELYRASAKVFENIYWCLNTQLGDLQSHAKHDFMVFDSRLAIVEDYDGDGYFKGGWVANDVADVSSLSELFNSIKSSSAPIDHLRLTDAET